MNNLEGDIGKQSGPRKQSRKARTINLNDPKLTQSEETVFTDEPNTDELEAQLHDIDGNHINSPNQNPFSWLKLLFAGVISLFTLYITVYFISIATTLLNQQGPIRWIALGLLGLITLAFAILILKDIASLFKLRSLRKMREEAELALNGNDSKKARSLLTGWQKNYASRPYMKWALSDVKQYDGQLFEAKEMIDLADKKIGTALDKQARQIIINSARKVSVATAFVPFPLLDMFSVGYLNVSMLRQVAGVYGGRPGFFGTIRLSRMIFTHLILTGGLSLAVDFIKPLIGQSIAARLSKKLGEGLFNGALTARIGLATIDVVRPIPYSATKPLKLSKIIQMALIPARVKSQDKSTAKTKSKSL